jgi:sigma-E factor negative regulatory protein RseC
MIEQQGLVVAVSCETASVRLGGSSACPACDAGEGCGAGIFGRLLQRKPIVIELYNQPAARLGDAVMVGLPEAIFLRLVFSFYLFPLMAGLAGAAFGYYISVRLQLDSAASDGLTLLGAVLAGVFALMRKRQWHGKSTGEFPRKMKVHLLRVAEGGIAAQCDIVKPRVDYE